MLQSRGQTAPMADDSAPDTVELPQPHIQTAPAVQDEAVVSKPKRSASAAQLEALARARAARAQKKHEKKALLSTLVVEDESSGSEFEHVIVRRRKPKQPRDDDAQDAKPRARPKSDESEDDDTPPPTKPHRNKQAPGIFFV